MFRRSKKRALIASTACAFVLVLTVSACASAGQAGNAQGSEQASTTDATWSLKSDCSSCHTSEAASQSDSACLASLHAASDCASCHVDEAGLAAQHEGATAKSKMPKKLKKTSVESATCLSCHDSWEKLASATADLTVLTDEEGTTINPHDLPAGHVDEKTSCGDCHNMHAGEDASTAATASCQSCHHKNVYTCNTCH